MLTELLAAKETYDGAQIKYIDELRKIKPRAQEIAELFKQSKMSLELRHQNNTFVYYSSDKYTFRTKDDTKGLCDNILKISNDNQLIIYSCFDFENDEIGRYCISIKDFARDDWKEYFTEMIVKNKKQQANAKLQEQSEKDYKTYLQLKKKFEN